MIGVDGGWGLDGGRMAIASNRMAIAGTRERRGLAFVNNAYV